MKNFKKIIASFAAAAVAAPPISGIFSSLLFSVASITGSAEFTINSVTESGGSV